MERKVKSLIPIKSKNESLLTSLLLLVWSLLCVWAIGLLASSLLVKASSINQEWIENKSEAIYNMEFAKKWDLGNSFNYMYLSWNTFYVSWAWMFVDGNEVITDKNINILWWIGNNVKSENVTLLGGKHILVGSRNGNITILWWKGIEVKTWYDKIGGVLLGGENNFLSIGTIHKGWDVIIWWANLTWTNIEYVFLLWWSWNLIKWSNSIVWWIWVGSNNNNGNNFVFSDGSIDLTLNTSRKNVFGFIVKNWVWLGMKSLTSWLTSKWAVKIGTIDISTTCGSNNVWVMWAWKGCVVWCTKESGESGGYGKW